MKAITLILVCTLSALCYAGDKWKERAVNEQWMFSYDTSSTGHLKGFKKKELHKKYAVTPKKSLVVPNVMDLRQTADGGHRGLSAIQDQGQCGSCWAFSLTATLRDGWRLHGKDPLALSQQYLVDCATNESGCDGGYFDGADWFITPKGAPSQDAYPYTASQGTCKSDPIKASIGSWEMINPVPRDIESWIMENKAPVSITVAAGAGPWEMYQSGVYNGCTMGQTDHMINIVGWDNEGQKFDANGNLPPGRGKWLLRNSWGLSWGQHGWMTTKMTDAQGNRCNNVAEEVSGFNYATTSEATKK